ncbi:MAG: DUF2809 domain-containing protein [Polyangiaceae bacterium]|jgi:hypothetical protein|nr:DUF2809 domain-containing protein [Polyangiaceae bacterium]
MRRTSRAWVVALSFAAGAFVAVYRGPGWRPLRSHGGDVVATFFLFLLLGLIPWAGSARRRAIITGVIALGIELMQAGGVVNTQSSTATQLVFGSTFDPWDCLAYAVGIALGLALEAVASRPRRPRLAPSPARP